MAVWRVVFLQRVLNEEVRNVFYYSSTHETLSTPQLQELADDFRLAYVGARSLANHGPGWRGYGINVKRADSGSVPSIDVGFTLGDMVGAGTGENLPTQVALLAHGVAYTDKPNRVRTYMPGWMETHITSGVWNAGTLTVAVNTMIAIGTLVIDGVTYSRVSAKVDPATDLVIDENPIGVYFASDVPATQRRRRIGRGM